MQSLDEARAQVFWEHMNGGTIALGIFCLVAILYNLYGPRNRTSNIVMVVVLGGILTAGVHWILPLALVGLAALRLGFETALYRAFPRLKASTWF